MFIQSIKFYTIHFIITFKGYRCLKKVIHQIDSKNKNISSLTFLVKMNGCSFQQVLRQNLSLFLSQHWNMISLRGLILKPTERAYTIF